MADSSRLRIVGINNASGIGHLQDSVSEEDPLGECERYINQIRRELALPEREGYLPVKQQSTTPYSTAHRILGELTFVRTDARNRVKKFRLVFDVANVSATDPRRYRQAWR